MNYEKISHMCLFVIIRVRVVYLEKRKIMYNYLSLAMIILIIIRVCFQKVYGKRFTVDSNRAFYFIYLSLCCVRILADDLASKNSPPTSSTSSFFITVLPLTLAVSAAGVSN